MLMADARSAVRDVIGNRTDVDALILTSLNWAQHRIVLLIPTRGSHKVGTATIPAAAITAHEFRFALPNAARTILGISLINGTSSSALSYLTRKDRQKNYPNPITDSQGEPEFFTLYSTWFELTPPPSTDWCSLECHLSCWPTDLVGVADVVQPIGLEYQTVKLATYYTFMGLKEFGAAAQWKALADEEIAVARQIELERLPENLQAAAEDMSWGYTDRDVDDPFVR